MTESGFYEEGMRQHSPFPAFPAGRMFDDKKKTLKNSSLICRSTHKEMRKTFFHFICKIFSDNRKTTCNLYLVDGIALYDSSVTMAPEQAGLNTQRNPFSPAKRE